MMATRRIPVEVALDPRRYWLRAELPGIDPVLDLRVTWEGSELRLDVARPAPARTGRSEFRYGRRLRLVAIPPDVRPQSVAARYVDGVLEVTADRGPVEPSRPAFRVEVQPPDRA